VINLVSSSNLKCVPFLPTSLFFPYLFSSLHSLPGAPRPPIPLAYACLPISVVSTPATDDGDKATWTLPLVYFGLCAELKNGYLSHYDALCRQRAGVAEASKKKKSFRSGTSCTP